MNWEKYKIEKRYFFIIFINAICKTIYYSYVIWNIYAKLSIEIYNFIVFNLELII